MKTLFVLFIAGICFVSMPSPAEEYTTKISPRVMLNLSLLPQETNLPNLDVVKPMDDTKLGLEIAFRTLTGKQSISSDPSTPIFIRINRRGVSIRFERKFD